MDDSQGDRHIAIERARLDQFRSDRWQNIAGQFGAGPALVAISWNAADHGQLLVFGLVHHVMVWLMALSFVFPIRRRSAALPLTTFVGAASAQSALSAGLLFDRGSAEEPMFAMAVGLVLFACAAGSLATLGGHPRLLRVALTSLLIPYAITGFMFGHVAIALGTLFFYAVVVIVAVAKVSAGHEELVRLRLDAADRAAVAEKSARTDPLTGVTNRHGLTELEGIDVGAGVSALFVDIDRFKSINDSHGHAAGDVVLQVLARRIRAVVSDDDVVARLGGDEFIVVVRGADEAVAEDLKLSLQQKLGSPVTVPGIGAIAVSASVGLAHAEGASLNVSELLKASDQAMYAAKSRRNKTEQPSGDRTVAAPH